MSADFLNSNILIYLFDDTDPKKRGIAEKLVLDALDHGAASISFQVIQETLNIITRKLKNPATPGDARRFLDDILLPLWRIMPSPALDYRCLDIQERYRYSFYDSLILAAALDAGCTRLYSEDMQHSQQVETLTIENPFLV